MENKKKLVEAIATFMLLMGITEQAQVADPDIQLVLSGYLLRDYGSPEAVSEAIAAVGEVTAEDIGEVMGEVE